ncbi:uncharacterized protein LOC133420914 [Cololabis saira]|uniref:uncharacterized protein LOC133420914 n=1 Tax=Cololabis saira TaxID=129043 RepID=UPI002AD3E954|nr:uncharacterized protein LOC133420914 [Cololabis saira]
MSTTIKKLAEELEEIKKSLNFMSEEISKVVKQQVNLMGLMEEVRELRNTIKIRDEIERLEQRIDDLEQYSRADDLIITGLATKHHSYARILASDQLGEDVPTEEQQTLEQQVVQFMNKQESRDIVHIVSLDKRETNRNSVIMEKECFIRTMDALLPEIRITEVVTDAHTQISALLNPEHGKYKEWGLQYSLDIWHAAKSLGKKLRRAGTVREQSELLPWIRHIVNHFWYCAKQASSVEDFKMKWHAVIHHVRNQHTWATGACEHEPVDDDAQEKPWIKQGSAAHQALVAVVLDERWLKDVKTFITFRTTSDLKNFQNHILMYAGKRYSYTPAVYHTRTLLAAIDYNCHNGRLPARNKDGHKM